MLITERERTGRSWKRGLTSRLLRPGLEQAPAGGGGEQTPLSSQKSPSLQLPLARGGRALPEEGEELQLLAAKPWLCCSCGWQGAPSSLHPRGDERNLGIPRRSGPGIPQGLFWWAWSTPGTLRRGWSGIPFPHPEQHPGCSRGCSRAFPVGSKAGAGCWAQFLPEFLLWGHGPGAGKEFSALDQHCPVRNVRCGAVRGAERGSGSSRASWKGQDKLLHRDFASGLEFGSRWDPGARLSPCSSASSGTAVSPPAPAWGGGGATATSPVTRGPGRAREGRDLRLFPHSTSVFWEKGVTTRPRSHPWSRTGGFLAEGRLWDVPVVFAERVMSPLGSLCDLEQRNRIRGPRWRPPPR